MNQVMKSHKGIGQLKTRPRYGRKLELDAYLTWAFP
jgi:hypothetical protein